MSSSISLVDQASLDVIHKTNRESVAAIIQEIRRNDKDLYEYQLFHKGRLLSPEDKIQKTAESDFIVVKRLEKPIVKANISMLPKLRALALKNPKLNKGDRQFLAIQTEEQKVPKLLQRFVLECECPVKSLFMQSLSNNQQCQQKVKGNEDVEKTQIAEQEEEQLDIAFLVDNYLRTQTRQPNSID